MHHLEGAGTGSVLWMTRKDTRGVKLLKQKSDTPYEVMKVMQQLNDSNCKVEYIRCDDAGENKKLHKMCENSQKEMYRRIKFEFTSGESPELNGKVERKIAVITRGVRAMLNAANIDKDRRKKLWGEAVMHQTFLENVMVSRKYDKARTNEWNHKDFKHLRQFGEIAYIKYGPSMKGKLENRGIPMMYLGRADNHSNDTSRFLNLATNRVVLSRNAVWLGKTYGEWVGMKLHEGPDRVTVLPAKEETTDPRKGMGSKVTDVEEATPLPTRSAVQRTTARQESVVTDVEEAPVLARSQGTTNVETEPRSRTGKDAVQRTMSTRATRIDAEPVPLSAASLRELTKIEGALNPEATTLVEQIQANAQGTETSSHVEMMNCAFLMIEEGVSVNTMYEILLFVSQVEAIEYKKDDGSYDKPTIYDKLDPSKYKETFENPEKFEEAWNHEEPFQRKKWREGIHKELTKMHSKRVWERIKVEDMEEG